MKKEYTSFSDSVIQYFDLNKQPLLSPLSLYTSSISSKINNLLRRETLTDDFSPFEGLQYDLCQNTIFENITVWRLYLNNIEVSLRQEK